MVQPWLKEVQIALHDRQIANATIDGKLREIRTFHDGIKSVKVGEFTFITQNLAKTTEWAKLAREGKKVTQVKRGNAWYGVIVDDKVMRYQGHGKEPIVVGHLPTVEEGQVKLTEDDEIPLSAYNLAPLGEVVLDKLQATEDDKLLEGPIEAGQTSGMTLPEVVEKLLHGIRTGQIAGDKLGETKDLLVSALKSHLERAL